MNDLFYYTGQDGSMGYRYGKIYMLQLSGRGYTDLGVVIEAPERVPYDSWEEFFKNWQRVS